MSIPGRYNETERAESGILKKLIFFTMSEHLRFLGYNSVDYSLDTCLLTS